MDTMHDPPTPEEIQALLVMAKHDLPQIEKTHAQRRKAYEQGTRSILIEYYLKKHDDLIEYLKDFISHHTSGEETFE